MSEIKRCPSCKRNKNKAISEQVSKGEPCDVPRGNCVFAREIAKAIEEKTKIRIVKKIRVVKKS